MKRFPCILLASFVLMRISFFPIDIKDLVNSSSGASLGALQMHSNFFVASCSFSLFSSSIPFNSPFVSTVEAPFVPVPLQFWVNWCCSKQLQLLSKARPLIKSPMVNFWVVTLEVRLLDELNSMPVWSLLVRLWEGLNPVEPFVVFGAWLWPL